MKIKFLILFSLFSSPSFGQSSIKCTYQDAVILGKTHYTCFLDIINPDGFDNFQQINGTHLTGRTNADVTAVETTIESQSRAFPQILCSTFENLVRVNYHIQNVAELGENTLSRCTNLEFLSFWWNRIEVIHERAFANNNKLSYLNLYYNSIQQLPENVFQNLPNLDTLTLSLNPLGDLPVGIFRNLNLTFLSMNRARLSEFNTLWFKDLRKLEVLSLFGNYFTSLPQDSFSSLVNLIFLDIGSIPLGNPHQDLFRSLTRLQDLDMSNIGMTQINPNWFASLQNLEYLIIDSNRLHSIPENVFSQLRSLRYIDISDNHLTTSNIPGTTFNNMPVLQTLLAANNEIHSINSQWFQNTRNLTVLNMDGNEIAEIPTDAFTSFSAIQQISLANNRVNIIRRNLFGNLENLKTLNFDNNDMNAIEEELLLDAVSLSNLKLLENICVDAQFQNFSSNRDVFLPKLGNCIRNNRYYVDTTTQSGDNYRFFDAGYPGFRVRIQANSNAYIALSPVNNSWTRMIEIHLGANNNTITVILRGGEAMTSVQSPNLLRQDHWVEFRITWANQVILVTLEDEFIEAFPFISFTMDEFFPINFYGLRSSIGDANWNIRPFFGHRN